MPILMIIEVPGMSTDTYDRTNEHAGAEEDVPEGLISHVASVEDDTLIVADVWESEGAINRFFEERLGAALAANDVEAHPRFFPVHNHIVRGAGSHPGVLVLWEADGFTPPVYDELIAKMPAHGGDGSAHPSYSHVAGVTDDGMVFVDVWDSPESIQRFLEEQIIPAAGGATPPGQPRFARVHNAFAGAQRQPA